MDDQTEWFDEQYYDSPDELPNLTIKEMFEQIAAQFQSSMKAVADAYRPIAKAFGSSFHSEGYSKSFGIYDEVMVDDLVDGKPRAQTAKELIEQNKHRNHGPRQGSPYKYNGKRNW